uniref:Uncharacterized protein n=1 Tax=Leersia perrieri TaxID=77586 RepID=A0A0D9X964_9ORYZ
MARDSPLMPGSVLPKSKIRKREEVEALNRLLSAGVHRGHDAAAAPTAPGRMLDHLRQASLSSHVVFRDFMSRRISSLQSRERPAWFYSGVTDGMRTFVGAEHDMDASALGLVISRTLGVVDETLTLMPPDVTPLCRDLRHDHILAARRRRIESHPGSRRQRSTLRWKKAGRGRAQLQRIPSNPGSCR